MKTRKLILWGIAPMAVGFLMNHLLTVLPGVAAPFTLLLNLIFLFAWEALAADLSVRRRSAFLQALILCSFGLLMLGLILYQENVLGAYWGNLLGTAPQFFFLPFLSLVSTVITSLSQLFGPIPHGLWAMYIAEWILLLLVSWIGAGRARG